MIFALGFVVETLSLNERLDNSGSKYHTNFMSFLCYEMSSITQNVNTVEL